MMFRVMFHTTFVRSNMLMLNRDEIDVLWDARDQFSGDFRVEALFLDDNVVPNLTTTFDDEDGNETGAASHEEFFEVEEIISNVMDGQESKVSNDPQVFNHIERKEDWKEDFDPPAFHDCASDNGNLKHDKKSYFNVVKDKCNTSITKPPSPHLSSPPGANAIPPPPPPSLHRRASADSPPPPIVNSSKAVPPPPPPPPFNRKIEKIAAWSSKEQMEKTHRKKLYAELQAIPGMSMQDGLVVARSLLSNISLLNSFFDFPQEWKYEYCMQVLGREP